ncbi:glycine--tRNA ligase subunit beta [Sphingorhabdus arenilitoris]|uniref:Glycine--tRNA ligase beta subunit n=1 Tax=Sphingorhabdus arenilitoris TaxID=1490041 RepID=A0ABV8RGM4_9SPHN
MSDFLLELRSEEVPARMQAGARADLEKLFIQHLSAAGLKADGITVYSTPRRLALIARGLPDQTEAVSEEAKGPPEGAPDAAIDGFCRKNGVGRDALELRDVKGRMTYFAVINKPGRASSDVLAEAIPAIIRSFPWPKSQRWGADSISTESLRWVRPLSGIIALLGGDVVPFEIGGIAAGRETVGHRFHHSGVITIGGADDYAAKLRAAHVIVDHEERQELIRSGAQTAAEAAGLTLIADEGLVIENAGLTEWPVPLLGRFDEAFLDVPPEVIQLTARVNQKYFVCESPLPPAGGAGGGPESGAISDMPTPTLPPEGERELANAFICTANIDAHDGGAAIVAGNEKVLAARLSDAKFFWELDQKTSLAGHAAKLERITFHEKLGTVADKVERVAKLARWLCEEGIVTPLPPAGGAGGGHMSEPETTSSPAARPTPNPSRKREGDDVAHLADLAEQAARLCKADLVTEMVGEFPELQGLMGGYYAAKEGLPVEVSDAIRDHYKPVGQGDDVPTAPVTVAVSLADKLDTLVGFFQIDEKPTGSKDPFALRRAAIGILSLILENGLRASMFDLIAASAHSGKSPRKGHEIASFLIDRLKVQQRDAGVRHDMVDAIIGAEKGGDNVRMVARVKALQAFVATDEGTNLLAGYKRAANILKSSPSGEGDHAQHGGGARAESYSSEGGADPDVPLHRASAVPLPAVGEDLLEQEQSLLSALNAAEPAAAAAIAAEDFEGAMASLASLRAPIDAFFEGVMVNDPDPEKRAFRIGLLTRFRDAVHSVADFSKIEG